MFVALVVQALHGQTAPAAAQAPADPLAQARGSYNDGRLDEAIAAAARARLQPAIESAARLVEGRALLERYRRDRNEADLSAGRLALLGADPARLDPRGRTELLVGLAEALFLEEAFGAAAEVFDSALDAAGALDRATRDRVLDWWATSLDRQAHAREPDEAALTHGRVLRRMEEELRHDQASGAASYWLAVSARSLGDLDRAWHAAVAGWVRAPLTADRGAVLRADLDQFVREGVIPDRARRLADSEDEEAIETAVAVLALEWEETKARWTRE